MEMPQEWRVSMDETATVINARWWEQFNDPVLDDLIQEALESNYDLRLATARIAPDSRATRRARSPRGERPSARGWCGPAAQNP